MMYAEFDESLVTGNEVIDGQHKELIEKINKLVKCVEEGGGKLEAIKMLEGFTPQGDKGVSPQFIAALANCYAADGQLDKAVDTFKKAASEADNAATSPQYLIEAGLLLESQKKNDEALKIYEQIKKDYPQSSLVAPQQMQGGYVSAIDKYIERVSK